MKEEEKRELIKWIADYAYRKANPNSKRDTPSVVYEQVERDFNNWIALKGFAKSFDERQQSV